MVEFIDLHNHVSLLKNDRISSLTADRLDVDVLANLIQTEGLQRLHDHSIIKFNRIIFKVSSFIHPGMIAIRVEDIDQ